MSLPADVAVIGGGPAGMMAAGRAAEAGASVLLIEKNTALGRKLLITGGGRYSDTNAEPDARTLAGHYGTAGTPTSCRRSASSLRRTRWLGSLPAAVPTKIEDGQRAFPADDQASSILGALERYLRTGRVKLALGREVTGLAVENRLVTAVSTRRGPSARPAATSWPRAEPRTPRRARRATASNGWRT